MVEINFSKPCTDRHLQELIEMTGTRSSAHVDPPVFIEDAEGKVVGIKADPYFESSYRDWAKDIDLADES